MKTIAKIVLANIVIFGFLVFLLNTLSIVAIIAFNWGKPKQYAESHLLPNYVDDDWAIDHFTEYYELSLKYESYYGWRRLPYAGSTINIDADGLRATYVAEDARPTRSVAFFGGSTTWGTGAYDDATIPSEFVKRNPDYEGFNFGETGYVAHQGLNMFLKAYYEGMRSDLVIFYDGVNDVWNKCRYELDTYSHSREEHIRKILDEGTAQNPESLWFTVQPIYNFATKAARVLEIRARGAQDFYDCDNDPAKAERVARGLLSDWQVVKNIVEGYGGTFVGVLQPMIYDSKTKTDHLELSEALGQQYHTVYPMILDMLARDFSDLAGNFLDLRDSLDVDAYLYIDWCHLSPQGNALVAARLSDGVHALAADGADVAAAAVAR